MLIFENRESCHYFRNHKTTENRKIKKNAHALPGFCLVLFVIEDCGRDKNKDKVDCYPPLRYKMKRLRKTNIIYDPQELGNGSVNKGLDI